LIAEILAAEGKTSADIAADATALYKATDIKIVESMLQNNTS
jgi:hypothetical protein